MLALHQDAAPPEGLVGTFHPLCPLTQPMLGKRLVPNLYTPWQIRSSTCTISTVEKHLKVDFSAMPVLGNETHMYFRALIQVQPIKTRMCHVTSIQAIHIIAIWSVSCLSRLPLGALRPRAWMTNWIHSKFL